MNRQKRNILIAAAVLAAAGGWSRMAAGEEAVPPFLTGVEDRGQISSGEESALPFVPEDEWLPAYYNSAEQGRKPTVKSQGSYGTCWALAATSALEAALLPQERIVFSADHLALNNAFTVPVDEGGDYLMTMAYLSGWQGPVTEAEDPYGDAYSPDGLEAAVHVQEMQLYDGAARGEIKAAIRRYGALQTSLYMNRRATAWTGGCYQEWTSAYYDPEVQVQDHDIIILGWDDHFSRFLFRQFPEEDGAWICQNTWGGEFGEDGIFYVSYADANIGRAAIAYTRIEPADRDSAVYQTDPCGWQGSQGYGDGDAWFANCYEAEADETLAAVGFYAVGADTSYEIYLQQFSGSDRTEISQIDFSQKTALQSGSIARAGYYTVDLEEPVRLKAGEVFAVIVKIHTPDTENPVAVEYRADAYTEQVTLEGKYGYLSHDGERWTHTETVYGTNVCLKAYTVR